MQKFKKIGMFVVLFVFSAMTLLAQSKKPGSNAAEIQASKIIGFTNTIIDLGNNANKYLQEYSRVLERADDLMKRVEKGRYDKKFKFSSIFYVNHIPEGSFATYDEAAKSAVSFPEKAELTKLVADARKSTPEIDSACVKLERYFLNYEFENDEKFSQYPVLVNNVNAAWKNSRIAWRTATNRASDVGENAELILIKKNKAAPLIIPMKTDLKGLDRIWQEMADLFEGQQATAEDVQTIKGHISNVQASIDKNKGLAAQYKTLLDNPTDYVAFYEHAENCLKNMGIAAEELGKTKQEANSIDGAISNVKNEYNQTVEYYNYLIDVIGK